MANKKLFEYAQKNKPETTQISAAILTAANVTDPDWLAAPYDYIVRTTDAGRQYAVKRLDDPICVQKLLLWDTSGAGVLSVLVYSATTGTLSPAESIVVGHQRFDVALSATAIVVSADVPISFPEFIP